MKYLILFALTLFTTHTFSQTAVQQKVSEMLDQMVKNKMITQAEADKAKLKMMKMSPEQWAALNKEAEAKAQAEMQSQQTRGPASVGNDEGPGDIEGAQLEQIQSDMDKMLPRQ